MRHANQQMQVRTNQRAVQVWHALWIDDELVCETAETEGLGRGKRQRKQVKTFEPEM